MVSETFAFLVEDAPKFTRHCSKLFFHLAWPTAVASVKARYWGAGSISRSIALGAEKGRNILLITDGADADQNPAIDSAKGTGCRIFTLGLGHAPSRLLLSRIAEVSGSLWTALSPEEHVVGHVKGLVERMRSSPVSISVSRPGNVLWHSRVPTFATSARTLHCEAVCRGRTALPGHVCGGSSLAVSRKQVAAGLRKVAAKARVGESNDAAERERLSVENGLLSSSASLLMTVERSADDKACALPSIVRIPQMPKGIAGLVSGSRGEPGVEEEQPSGYGGVWILTQTKSDAKTDVHSFDWVAQLSRVEEEPEGWRLFEGTNVLKENDLYVEDRTPEQNYAFAVYVLMLVGRQKVSRFRPDFLAWMTDALGEIGEEELEAWASASREAYRNAR